MCACDIIWLRIAAGWVIVFVIRSVAAIKMCTDKELTMHDQIRNVLNRLLLFLYPFKGQLLTPWSGYVNYERTFC